MKALQLMFCNFRPMLLYHSTPKDPLGEDSARGIEAARQCNPPGEFHSPLIRHGQVARLFSLTQV
jgi:hypothetical protein